MELPLERELLDLIVLLQTLSPSQVSGFLSFVRHGEPRLDFQMLSALVKQCTAAQLERLVAIQPGPGDEAAVASLGLVMTRDQLRAFASLYRLHLLQQLLDQLNEMQLMKVYEMIPQEYDQIMQSQLLQQIQEFLNHVLPDTLQALQNQIDDAEPGCERQHLIQLLDLRSELFHLAQPILSLLQLDWEDLARLHQFLPKMHPVQAVQLLQLLRLGVYDVLEMRQALVPRPLEGVEGMEEGAPRGGPAQPPRLAQLVIVEQPPERHVYKRNLKPNPTVRIVDDGVDDDSNLFLVPILVRCDTLEEQPRLMTGTQPVKITNSKVIVFKKLKVTATSHQQGETLFCIKFELRRYTGDEYQTIATVQSNPMCILSHSTQLKPSASATVAPVVVEVVPFSGSTSGGTRVAVIGANFVDNPALRVRFDNIDVMPIFHGPGTLICSTPQHSPGPVPIRVSNDNKRWSETTGTFTYEDVPGVSDAALASLVPAAAAPQFQYGAIDASTLSEAAWHGSLDGVKLFVDHGVDVNGKDSRRFTALHYAAASGFYAVAHFLLTRGADPNVRDDAGNTPLFWAAFCGHADLVLLLLQAGAVPHLSNWVGESPLLAAVQARNEQMVGLLLCTGAVNAACLEGGLTPLHLAASLGADRIAFMLLHTGAFVNVTDDYGETPLVYAVKEGQSSTAQFLLTAGADPRALEEEAEPAAPANATERKFTSLPSFTSSADAPRSRTAAACAMVVSQLENPLRPIRTLC